MALRFYDENGQEIEKYKIPPPSTKAVYEIEIEKPNTLYEPTDRDTEGNLTDMT